MDLSLIISAFIAGVLTFLAPCTLPLVPGYLGFISGVSLDKLNDPAVASKERRNIILNGLFFVLGFSIIFIAFGVIASFIGISLLAYRLVLSRIGGIFVILFGLFMLNVLSIPFLQAERQLHAPALFRRGKAINSLILGSAFGFGWTPCIGPVLGSILILASNSSTIFQGAFLLMVFSLGLAIPFLLIAASIAQASSYIAKFSRYLNLLSIIGGVFLIFLGILLLTGRIALLVSYGYWLFQFINYDRLLNYL